MYIGRTNAPRTSSDDKGSTSHETKPDYKDARQVGISRSTYYGLTWTPSSDEKLPTDEVSPRSLSLSPPILDTIRINDRRTECPFSKPYELNHPKDLPKVDREHYSEMHTKPSTKTPTAASSSNDLDFSNYWLSGEKFFETPPKYIYATPTRDRSDNEDIKGGTKDKKEPCGEIILYDTEKRLMNKIDDLKGTTETSNYDDVTNKIRRSSSLFTQSSREIDGMKKYPDDPPSRSTIQNVTSSYCNFLEGVKTTERTNIHNYIYLSSGYLDRYFDIPLSKFIKLTRRNARVRCILRRNLKKPKRSRSRLAGAACRVSSTIEMESLSYNRCKGRAFSKRNVSDVLAEIDTELAANLRSVEKLRELLPSCIPIPTIFTSEIKRTLNGIAKRYKNRMRNSNGREQAIVKMDDRLLKIVFNLLDLIKREKCALLEEEQYYTQLQSVSILGRQDFQKIKRLRNDVERVLLNDFRHNLSHWKLLVKKLLNEICSLTNEICAIEDNKENIKKPINRKTNDGRLMKGLFTPRLDGKMNSAKKEKRVPIKKENQMDTQMSLLSKVQPTMSIGKCKTSTKDPDGYRDGIKIKEIGDQRNRILKENGDRTERQNLGKTKESIHVALNVFGQRLTDGENLENPKVNDTAKLSASRQKRQNSNNAAQPVWKPGGAFKSLAFNNSTVLNTEPLGPRTLQVLRDKENSELARSVPVKHANPSEPTASRKNMLKENRKSENFREERVSKFFKLLAQDKMQKRSNNGANLLSETRSSMYTQSEIPLSDIPGTKTLVKSSEVNLSRVNCAPRPRPGIRRFTSNNKMIPNNLQRDTKTLLDVKSETLPLTNNSTDKRKRDNSFSYFSTQLDETKKTENEDILNEQKLEESVTSDTIKPSMIPLDDKDKLQDTLSSTITDNELNKNISQSNSMISNPQKSSAMTLSSISTINIDCDLRSESGPSFVSVADASCNVEFSSASNSIMMFPSSKCCQVSLSSSSSRTCLNDDQSYDKNQLVEKDSLKSSTDDESNYETPLSSDRPKRKNKHQLSFNSLKDVLYDLGIGADLVQQIEKVYQCKTQNDRRKSMVKCNISKSFTPTIKSPVFKISIDPEADVQSPRRYEFKSNDNQSLDSKGSPKGNMSTVEIEKSTLREKKSTSSQTISKEFSYACTHTEDLKSDRSVHVDAAVSCHEMGLEMSSKDIGTEIVAEDMTMLLSQRTIETQTNLYFTSSDNVAEFGEEKEDKKEGKDSNDSSIETKDQKCEQPNDENQDNIFQHDVSNNDNKKSSECLLNSRDDFTIVESPLPNCVMHKLEDIKEQLQNFGEQLHKLQEPAKETSDAFSQISTIASTVSKPIEISTSTTSGISEESFEEFNIDFTETKEICLSSDIINAFQTMEWYASNWYEALGIYKEYSITKGSEEYEKDSIVSSSSDEAVNVSKKDEFVECNIPPLCESDNEDPDRSCDNEETEIGTEEASCSFVKKPFHKTTSLPTFSFPDFYGEEMTTSTSQKSSRYSIFFDTQTGTDKVRSSTSLKDRSTETMKHSERIRSTNENEETQDAYDSSEFVLSRESLLLLTYLTICAFVFCCLEFSMTCESWFL